jgi:Leucine-rich repeat (LRR) protein
MFSIPGIKTVPMDLKVLDLSHNHLVSLPALIPSTLACLEELILNHNMLLEMTTVDMSRLVLNLPTLRRLEFLPQNKAQQQE